MTISSKNCLMKKNDLQLSSADQNLLIEEIRSQCTLLHAIMLVGSFGRYEGGVLTLGGVKQPINDYDLLVVGKKKVDVNIETVRVSLAKKLRVRQIDIVFYRLEQLKFLKKTMFNFDLRYGSALIFGDVTVYDRFPSWRNNKLPSKEGLRPLLLFTTSLLFSYGRQNSDKERCFWRLQQISKAVLGWSCAELISKDAYDPSYKIRCKNYQNLNVSEQRKKLVSFATKSKLFPNSIYGTTVHDIDDLWRTATIEHLSVLFQFSSWKFNASIDNLETFERAYMNSFDVWARRVVSRLKIRDYMFFVSFDLCKLYAIEYLLSGAQSSKRKLETHLNKVTSISIQNSTKVEIANLLLSLDVNATQFRARGDQLFYD